jgi:protein-S-isoprenylcysteine O-methyltransferase Ste14
MPDRRSTPFFFHRNYWLVQALAVVLWWVGVFTQPELRRLTLGSLPRELVYADLLILVAGGAVAARSTSHRWSAIAGFLVVVWLVAAGVWTWAHAWTTPHAGLGAVMMGLAALASAGTLAAQLQGGIPWSWLIIGPFRFRTSSEASMVSLLLRTALQILVFWTVFLGMVPWLVQSLERQFDLELPWMHNPAITIAGWTLFLSAGAIGLISGATMVVQGAGTPLPARQSRRLVVAGPYRYVRNPMAVTGIAQGVAVGMILGSWMVVLYAVIGSLGWDGLIRPAEEADMRARFGSEFDAYANRVRCWIPSLPRSGV